MQDLLDRLQSEFGISDVTKRHERLTTFKVARDKAETLIRQLRDRENFTHLNFVTAIDYIEDGVFTLVTC
jgi:NADH-quinone oxidoreductase subunit C